MIQAGREFLSHHDVVVESPTGSGKTLAYLLPTFAILNKRGKFGKHEFGAVILSPSRELSSQIASVAKPFAEELGYSIAVTVGGTKVEQNLKKLKSLGGNILIATPGRLFQLLSLDKDGSLKRSLRTVEVLIVDEADRFHETQFEIQGNILIATPGRLFQLLSLDKDGSLKRSLRTVEVLIVDEADRFHETQFEIQ
ncbi:unnamed protein product [Strongylus vulgaris]|uniref:ATP-dependent RNA helicase n=1 Tax=Strongylus vulgaris TaxID=40348 RepID=A0A3P7J9C2_STRVU|nr:unnamed protein product [Strongylus vulgaris]